MNNNGELIKKRVDEIKNISKNNDMNTQCEHNGIILCILNQLQSFENIHNEKIKKNRLFEEVYSCINKNSKKPNPLTEKEFGKMINYINREGLIDMKINGTINISVIGKAYNK
jgi:hypothetical protein